MRGGQVFADVASARAHFASRGVPRLSIFREVKADDLCALAERVRNVTLVLDEVDRICDGKAFTSDAAHWVVHEGRNWGVDLWGTARATRCLNEDIIGQADVLFLFHHSEADVYTLDTLRRRFPHLVGLLPGLRRWEFLVWSDDLDAVPV